MKKFAQTLMLLSIVSLGLYGVAQAQVDLNQDYVNYPGNVNMLTTPPEEGTPGVFCGDGTVNQASEQCDDSNTISGDGCSATCQNEGSGHTGGGGGSTGGLKPECRDGIDNDKDGKIDYPDDPGCTSANDWSEADGTQEPDEEDDTPAAMQCNDGFDNDGDGKIDFPDDKGCDSLQDNSENSDGIAGPGELPDSGPAEVFLISGLLGAGAVVGRRFIFVK